MAVLITIKTDPKFRPGRQILAACIQVGVIGIGILAKSPAMQWSGFLSLVLIGVMAAVMSEKRDTGLTIEQARGRLDELETTSPKTTVRDYGK